MMYFSRVSLDTFIPLGFPGLRSRITKRPICSFQFTLMPAADPAGSGVLKPGIMKVQGVRTPGGYCAKGIKRSVPGKKPRHKIHPRLLRLKHTAMPAILVETGFITNDHDIAYLVNKVHQKEIATGDLKCG